MPCNDGIHAIGERCLYQLRKGGVERAGSDGELSVDAAIAFIRAASIAKEMHRDRRPRSLESD